MDEVNLHTDSDAESWEVLPDQDQGGSDDDQSDAEENCTPFTVLPSPSALSACDELYWWDTGGSKLHSSLHFVCGKELGASESHELENETSDNQVEEELREESVLQELSSECSSDDEEVLDCIEDVCTCMQSPCPIAQKVTTTVTYVRKPPVSPVRTSISPEKPSTSSEKETSFPVITATTVTEASGPPTTRSIKTSSVPVIPPKLQVQDPTPPARIAASPANILRDLASPEGSANWSPSLDQWVGVSRLMVVIMMFLLSSVIISETYNELFTPETKSVTNPTEIKNVTNAMEIMNLTIETENISTVSDTTLPISPANDSLLTPSNQTASELNDATNSTIETDNNANCSAYVEQMKVLNHRIEELALQMELLHKVLNQTINVLSIPGAEARENRGVRKAVADGVETDDGLGNGLNALGSLFFGGDDDVEERPPPTIQVAREVPRPSESWNEGRRDSGKRQWERDDTRKPRIETRLKGTWQDARKIYKVDPPKQDWAKRKSWKDNRIEEERPSKPSWKDEEVKPSKPAWKEEEQKPTGKQAWKEDVRKPNSPSWKEAKASKRSWSEEDHKEEREYRKKVVDGKWDEKRARSRQDKRESESKSSWQFDRAQARAENRECEEETSSADDDNNSYVERDEDFEQDVCDSWFPVPNIDLSFDVPWVGGGQQGLGGPRYQIENWARKWFRRLDKFSRKVQESVAQILPGRH